MRPFTSRMLCILGAALLIAASACAQGTTTTELTSANAQRAEASFGDLAADALAQAAGTTIALVPAVAFKSGTIPAGPVTEGNVSALLTQPSENPAVRELTGAQLLETLERSVSRAPQPNAGFLQVAGITLTYDPSKPRNERIVEVKVGEADVDTSATYRVAMPLSLAKGGSGYFTIFGDGEVEPESDTGLASAIVSFVAERGSVSYTGTDRIKIAQ